MTSNVDLKVINNDHWYMKFKLPDEVITYLWDCIDKAKKDNIDHRRELAGNISCSLEMKDDRNIMVDTVYGGLYNTEMKNLFTNQIEKVFMRAFKKEALVDKPLKGKLGKLWVNFQKKHEFNPLHDHSGLFSFVIWMKIPYAWETEKELPWVKGSNTEQVVGNFVLVDDNVSNHVFMMDPSMEGHCVFFPSSFNHMVYPFYTSDEERISVSGNIFYEIDHLSS